MCWFFTFHSNCLTSNCLVEVAFAAASKYGLTDKDLFSRMFLGGHYVYFVCVCGIIET